MRRSLIVTLEGQDVGTLQENDGIWSLDYAPEWIKSGFPISPGLPLRESIVDTGSDRPVQYFFDNLLPEEDARKRLIQSLNMGPLDAWQLLTLLGGESTGALTLLPPGETLPAPDIRRLNNEDLEARIQAMPRIPLGEKAPKHMSIAGAQDKLLVHIDGNGQLHEPVGSEVSTHILKPDSYSDHYPASSINEWFCARLAKALKLPITLVELRYVPSSIYLISRFDRYFASGKWWRKHVIDGAQLLSLYAGNKYQRSGAKGILDIISLVRSKAPTRIRLFQWTLFNVLIGNNDAHLKNVSFVVDRYGIALAPFYDMLSTASWSTPEQVGAHGTVWPNIALTHPIGEATTFADVRRKHLHEFGDQIGLPKRTVDMITNAMSGAILQEARDIQSEFESRTDIPEKLHAGQSRMIRTILSMPISEMVKQLQ